MALYETCVQRSDFETGRRIMKAMLPLMTVLERGGKFVQCVKYACELDGLPAGETEITVRAEDHLGHVQRSAVFVVTVDSIAPQVWIDPPVDELVFIKPCR